MAKEKKWNWDLYEGKPGAAENTNSGSVDVSDAEMERLSDLMDRAVPLIEQVNSLYNQFRMGSERKPPIERRAVLDQVINSIQMIRKPTEGARFRVRQIISKFQSYKDRWDRIMKAMESGGDPYTKRKKTP